MGSLNIDFIAKDTTTKTRHLYSDLHLDLTNEYRYTGNYDKDFTNLVDIKVDYDMGAVKNALRSIFSTVPGERLLLPEFGVNIKRFIFSPVSEPGAHSIGQLLKYAVEKWEPRVIVDKFTIFPNYEDHRYDISFAFYVPSLKSSANLIGSIIQGEGFQIG